MRTNPHAGDKQFVGPTKNTDPAPQAPQASQDAPQFKFRLSLRDRVPIGSLGKSGSQDMWARIVPNENDAVCMNWYDDSKGNRPDHYLLLKGFGYMTWSTISGNPLAFNTYPYANRWKWVGNELVAADSGAPLSQYQDWKWVYANAGYKPLQIEVVVC